MADEPRPWGSPFACAPGVRLEAHERLAALQFKQVSGELERLEIVLDRMERRLWLTVYGVVAAVLTDAVYTIVTRLP